MHTKTIQKIQKAYIKTYEEDVKIYKDIENSQGQVFFFCKHRYHYMDFCGSGDEESGVLSRRSGERLGGV